MVRMTSRLRLSALLCAVVVLCASAAEAKKKIGFYKKPGTAEAAGFTVVPPAEGCSNWGWAAATESLLALDAVKVDQHVLVQKAYGGELCDDASPNFRALSDAVKGDYVVGPKRKLRVTTRVYASGSPISAEDLIAAMRRGRPMIFFWKAHAYVAVGAAYDEYVGPNGTRMWEIRELTLLDPTATDEEHRRVTFQKGRDNVADINGAIELVLMPIEEVDWLR